MADDATLASAWAHVIDSAPTPVKVWVKAAKPLALHESTLLVAVPNDFSRERIASRNRDLIEGSLTTFYGRAIHIAVSVDSSLEPDDGDADLAAPELPLEVTSHGLGASQVQAASTMAGMEASIGKMAAKTFFRKPAWLLMRWPGRTRAKGLMRRLWWSSPLGR